MYHILLIYSPAHGTFELFPVSGYKFLVDLTALITVALQKVLKSVSFSPPALLFQITFNYSLCISNKYENQVASFYKKAWWFLLLSLPRIYMSISSRNRKRLQRVGSPASLSSISHLCQP